MKIDLHTHTTASDGALTPAELIEKAIQRGVGVLAITDHDVVTAPDEPGGREHGLTLIPGIEWSTCWRRMEIHIIGLGVDPRDAGLRQGVAGQQRIRRRRAGRMAAKLEKLGVDEPLAGAERQAGHSAPGRPHFARHMLETGFVRDIGQAFRKYLAAGKPAWCRSEWPSMREVIDWTHAAGGLAVLAHPADYGLTRTRLSVLGADFRDAGGDAMEVVSGRQEPGVTAMLAALCRKMDLAASCGSDYHRTGPGCAEPGECGPLPPACRPVWELQPAFRGT